LTTTSQAKTMAALTSVGAAIGLTSMKLVVGLVTGSLGILAETAHSGLDLVAALMTFFAVRFAERPPDATHHYGHGKIENLSAFLEAGLLLLTAVWIIYEALHRLAGDVHVAGMTTKELQDKLTDQLKPFVKEPQVTIIARQIRSRKIYLMGEVVHPGTYQLNNMKTVLQLLAEAGGPGAYAKVGSIYVIRQQAGSRTLIPFHYKRALSGKNLADDIVLQPGDMVVVP